MQDKRCTRIARRPMDAYILVGVLIMFKWLLFWGNESIFIDASMNKAIDLVIMLCIGYTAMNYDELLENKLFLYGMIGALVSTAFVIVIIFMCDKFFNLYTGISYLNSAFFQMHGCLMFVGIAGRLGLLDEDI